MTLRAFGIWYAGVGVLVLLGGAVVLGWWLALPAPASGVATLGALLAAACLGAAVFAVRRVPPTRLHWDGQRWFVGVGGPESSDPSATDLTVAIDLGGWMLLRLLRQDAPRWQRPLWLPAQRRGHAAQWHALRCAVYSPRPAVGAPPGAEP